MLHDPAAELKSRPVTIESIENAETVVRRYMPRSPCRRYGRLSDLLAAEVYVKHENHNPTATFKIRGGLNVLHHVKNRDLPGVITFSTGNHGTSVAEAAAIFGLPAVVVVPEDTNPAKTRSIQEAGAELIRFGATFEESEQKVNELIAERDLYFVHPANEPELLSGVGTCFLEMLDQVPHVDMVITPLGAGSEVASAITCFRSRKPSVDVVAVQARASSAAYNSWKSGKISSAANATFAGGFATGKAYETTFEIYRNGISDFVLLDESELVEAMALSIHYTSNLAEAAGAAPILAAEKLKDDIAGKTIILQMSGGKAEPTKLAEAVGHQRIKTG